MKTPNSATPSGAKTDYIAFMDKWHESHQFTDDDRIRYEEMWKKTVKGTVHVAVVRFG